MQRYTWRAAGSFCGGFGGGAHHFRFRFLDLCIRFGKIISKVCEGFNSGAMKKLFQDHLDTLLIVGAYILVTNLSSFDSMKC